MRRKNKIILIISICTIITYLIYISCLDRKINILALGDGISSGEVSYNIDGISYNDYLKEYYSNKKILKSFNNKYSYKNYKLNILLNDIEDNLEGIKQLIHKSQLITIGIGEEELVKSYLTNDLNESVIKEFIIHYDELIKNIRKITNSKIFIISLYENKYLDKKNVIIINANLKDIAIKYNCVFLNINDLLLNKDYFLNNSDYYFNYKAHREIAYMIINSF